MSESYPDRFDSTQWIPSDQSVEEAGEVLGVPEQGSDDDTLATQQQQLAKQIDIGHIIEGEDPYRKIQR